VFGLKQVGRVDSPGASGYYLTDGDINLAILKFKSDAVAGVERGKDWSGLHHFGFQVEDMAAIAERLQAAGAPKRDDVNNALLGILHGRASPRGQRRGEVLRPRRDHGRRLRVRLGRHTKLQPQGLMRAALAALLIVLRARPGDCRGRAERPGPRARRQPVPAVSADTAYDRGVRARVVKDWKAAETGFRQAVALRPDFATPGTSWVSRCATRAATANRWPRTTRR
jgi:hypothetical protein